MAYRLTQKTTHAALCRLLLPLAVTDTLFSTAVCPTYAVLPTFSPKIISQFLCLFRAADSNFFFARFSHLLGPFFFSRRFRSFLFSHTHTYAHQRAATHAYTNSSGVAGVRCSNACVFFVFSLTPHPTTSSTRSFVLSGLRGYFIRLFIASESFILFHSFRRRNRNNVEKCTNRLSSYKLVLFDSDTGTFTSIEHRLERGAQPIETS